MPRVRRDSGKVRLQPADAFDLIRWLARTQSDPRKAVAELVQNAIDANARSIVVERRRRGRRPILVIRDDGDGIRPQEPRDAALRYIATHIGRSHKRNLSARERHEQVVAGKYGIGLLGFWSIGHRMEIRSRVDEGTTWLLRMIEDESSAEVVPGPPAIDQARTFTEIVISELHPAASRALSAQRLAEFLGAELRGQLLASETLTEVREIDTRGQLSERHVVVPRRFEGTRLDVPPRVAVPGYPPIAIELYQSSTGGGVELTCAGTVVADRIGDLAGLGLDTAPWTDRALAGTIEFSALAVPPGTRRGVIPDDAAHAFATALAELAPLIQRALDQLAVQRHAASERQMMVDLRRALRGLRDRLPFLGMPARIAGRGGSGTDRDADPLAESAGITNDVAPGTTIAPGDNAGDDPSSSDSIADEPVAPTLLPPGPAHHVRISPDPIRLWSGARRNVRATVFDVHGQSITARTEWSASSVYVAIDGEDLRRTLTWTDAPNENAPSILSLTITAEANGGVCSATAEIEIVEGPGAGGPGSGIPEPILVDHSGHAWRSRMSTAGWEVNIGHPDYGVLASDGKARLRYLVALFAKDLTVTTTHHANESVLDQMVDVIALAERNLLRTR